MAGVYPDGDACIEGWQFTYEAPTVPYRPIDRRPLPALERTELFRGREHGHIRSLEADPDGRFVLFLSYEDPTLYRITLPSGSPQVELTQRQVPYLIHAKQIVLRQHVREGRLVTLIQDPRWHADLRGFRRTIVLRDGDDDGIFDPPVLLSPEEWTAHGYEDYEAWTSV